MNFSIQANTVLDEVIIHNWLQQELIDLIIQKLDAGKLPLAIF